VDPRPVVPSRVLRDT